MILLRTLEKSKDFWFVLASSFVFFLLRLPSLFEPLWYGDEGIYQVIGTSLNNGKLLYKEIFDNKPPLLYWLYSFFQSDQLLIRLASLISGAFSIIIFFLLSKKLFRNKSLIHYLTTSIFAVLFGLPMLEGNIANAENFMLLPIIFSAFLILNAQKQNSNRPPLHHSSSIINHSSFIINPYFLAGLLLGIAFLLKIVAIFDFSAFLVFCFIVNFDSLKKRIKLFLILAGFSLPILIVSLIFLSNGTFADFIKAVFVANISYVNYANKIGSFPFLLFGKFILLSGFVFYVFLKRRKINHTMLFIFIWVAFSLFNSFFSQRPYTHYLLVLLPSLSLLVGLVFFEKKYQKITAIFLLIAIAVVIKGFGIPNFSKNTYYYQNFISYVNGGKSTASYQAFFDRNTPLDYEVALFIRPKLDENDTIFVWGNNAQLYQLVNVIAPAKYVVAYHITNYKDGVTSAKKAIEKTKPKFIVAMPNQGSVPFLTANYFNKINISNIIIYERLP